MSAAPYHAGARRAALPPASPRLIGLRVLVVGPTLDTCVAWASALERAGMIVEQVVGASRALDALARKPDVDVIVCGLRLGSPRLDGLDVLETAGRDLPGVRRVLLGSPVVEPLEHVILQHGPVDAIAWMPCAPGDLVSAVKRAA